MNAWLEVPSTEELLSSLREIISNGYSLEERGEISTKTEWTGFLAKELSKLCPPGCAPYGKQWAQDWCNEYLCDHVWGVGAKDSEDWADQKGLILAMECEWSSHTDARFTDFCKVADVQADRRLFIGQTQVREWHDRTRLASRYADWFQNHRHFRGSDEVGLVLICDGGDYPIAGWVLRGDGGVKECWTEE